MESAMPASKAQSDLTGTLRSFRDSLAFSFQTLNLTLSSMTQTMTNIGTKIGSLVSSSSTSIFPGANSQWVQTGTPGLYTGSLSQAYQQFSGANNLTGLLFANQQYNINPNEFWLERNTDIATRMSSVGVSTLGAVASEGTGLVTGSLAGKYLGAKLGLGNGVLGSVGRFAMGTPIGMGATLAANLIIDPAVQAAIQHNKDSAALTRMSARFRSPFTLRESQRAVSGIEDLAYNEILNTTRIDSRLDMSGFRDITMMGLQGNMFQGTTPEQLVKQISSASNVVKFLTGVLGSKDVQETMQTVKQLKDMGLNSFQNFSAIQAIGNDAFSYGRSLGIQSSTLLSAAASMSSVAFGQHGNPAFVGMRPAMRNIAFTSELEKRNMLTPAEIAAGGGVQAISGRLLSTQANLLNNGAIGGAMLYAGWNGAQGFNLQQYQAAIGNGGFWGSIGQAAQNITRGGLASIAKSLTEKNNIIASAAENGSLDKLLEIQLQNSLDIPLQMLPKNASIEDKVAMAALYLTQLDPSIDMSTAKAIAMKVINPRVQATVDRRAQEQYHLGGMEFSKENRGFGRLTDEIGENVEKGFARIKHNVIQRPARAIADAVTNTFDFSYQAQGALNQMPINSTDMEFYASAVDSLRRNPYRIPQQAQFNNADYVDAVDRLANRGTIGETLRGWAANGNMLLSAALNGLGITDEYKDGTFIGKDYNMLTDAMFVGSRNYMTPFWNRVASGKRATTIEGYSALAPLSNNDFSDRYMHNIFTRYSNKDPMAPLLGARDWYNEFANDKFKAATAENIKAIQEQLSAEDINNIIGNDINTTQDMNADDAARQLLISGARDRAVEVAQRIGRSREEVIAATANKRYGTKDISGLVGVLGSGKYSDIMLGAESEADTSSIQQLIGREDMKGLNFSGASALKFLNDVGLTREQVATLTSTFKDQGDLDAFASAMEKIDNGEDYVLDERFKGRRDIIDILEARKQDQRDSILPTFSKKHYGSEFKNAFNAAAVEERNKILNGNLQDIGISGIDAATAFSMSEEDAKAFLSNGGFKANNKTAQELLNTFNSFKNLSNEELAERLGYEKGTITDVNRNREYLKAGVLAFGNAGKIEEQKTNEAAMVMKTAVDSTVGKDPKGNYIRVKILGKDDVQKARDEVSKNTTGKSTNQGTNADQLTSWQQFVKDFNKPLFGGFR